MNIGCPRCNRIYNYDKESAICPHLSFPKPCKRHKQMHCGHLECINNVVPMISKKEGTNN